MQISRIVYHNVYSLARLIIKLIMALVLRQGCFDIASDGDGQYRFYSLYLHFIYNVYREESFNRYFFWK